MISFRKNGKCFIVAEVSANHGQNFKRAVSLVKTARKCGADAVKFQTYTPDTLTIDVNNRYFRIKHPQWGGQTLYQLYRKAYTPWKWFKKLKKVADSEGLVFFSTAFDKTAIDFLEELDVPLHKIASFELVDIPLIKYAARTMKPLILSTGMATFPEIREAVMAARKAGSKEIVVLKCVSSYPARPDQMNLNSMSRMRKSFRVPVGISDHTLGTGVSLAAVSLGAVMVEKHFTLSRKIKTVDSFFSIEPGELKELVSNIRMVEQAMGDKAWKITPGEKKMRVFRRSLFAVKDIKKGEKFTLDNVRSIRPSYGLSPKYLEKILGKRARKDIKRGTPLSLRMLGKS